VSSSCKGQAIFLAAALLWCECREYPSLARIVLVPAWAAFFQASDFKRKIKWHEPCDGFCACNEKE
jgi:hypothetical protein